MKIEDIMSEWDKDCKIDETELGDESTKIPVVHNKYMKIFMVERTQLMRMRAEIKKQKRILTEYYLGELDENELKALGREQFYKKLLKNEVDTYIESDGSYVDKVLKMNVQEEKVDYVEGILKSINNRGFQIKNAIDWLKFTNG
jgi:hypothetical protein